MNGFVVVDASLAVKWLVEENDSDRADRILETWESQDIRVAAPSLMPFEVTNALHRRVVRGDLTVEMAAGLIDSLFLSRLELHETQHLHRGALELASRLGQGAAYDSHYLALAETLGCELWTADEKFFRAARGAATAVRWIGEPS